MILRLTNIYQLYHSWGPRIWLPAFICFVGGIWYNRESLVTSQTNKPADFCPWNPIECSDIYVRCPQPRYLALRPTPAWGGRVGLGLRVVYIIYSQLKPLNHLLNQAGLHLLFLNVHWIGYDWILSLQPALESRSNDPTSWNPNQRKKNEIPRESRTFKNQP